MVEYEFVLLNLSAEEVVNWESSYSRFFRWSHERWKFDLIITYLMELPRSRFGPKREAAAVQIKSI